MASSSKRKTTMAKLNREAKLREKRFEKEARKQYRKLNPGVTHQVDTFEPEMGFDDSEDPLAESEEATAADGELR